MCCTRSTVRATDVRVCRRRAAAASRGDGTEHIRFEDTIDYGGRLLERAQARCATIPNDGKCLVRLRNSCWNPIAEFLKAISALKATA
jgi:hypothetical protein